MYIGDINWKYCRLETSFEFGNIKQHLVTYSAYWKHHFCLNAHIYYFQYHFNVSKCNVSNI